MPPTPTDTLRRDRGLPRSIEGIGEENRNGILRPLDILALEETASNDITVAPIISDLNNFYAGLGLDAPPVYAQSPVQGTTNFFIVNPSSDNGNGPNAIIYNTNTLQLLQSVGIGRPQGATNGESRQVMRYEFAPAGVTPTASNVFYVYVSHMKANSFGQDAALAFSNENRRNGEAAIIRNNAATLVTAANPNPSILYMGDLNLLGTAKIQDPNSTTAVSAYQTLTAPGYGQGLDPLNPSLDYTITAWNDPSIMTDSVSDLGVRFDIQLMTPNVLHNTTPGSLAYIPGSMHTFGNNGSIGIDGAVTDASNTALSGIDTSAGFGNITAAELQAYLATASDHYPLVADYNFNSGINDSDNSVLVPEPSSLVSVGAGRRRAGVPREVPKELRRFLRISGPGGHVSVECSTPEALPRRRSVPAASIGRQ